MPDQRRHRGRHPQDDVLFSEKHRSDLRSAVADLSWLLSRDYSGASALKLVGDRYQLAKRQRMAVMRSSVSDALVQQRNSKCIPLAQSGEAPIHIDGYNLLITVESALSGGLLFEGRDGCLRDIASLHGTYRTVEETIPALEMIGRLLAKRNVFWYLDAPVSNSRRLAQLIRKICHDRAWSWEVEVVNNPDTHLAAKTDPIVTTDSWILDHCQCWLNLMQELKTHKIFEVKFIPLNDDPRGSRK